MVEKLQKVRLVWLDYIGLPAASLLTATGFNVKGVDISQKLVDTITPSLIRIREPDLDILAKSVVNAWNLLI